MTKPRPWGQYVLRSWRRILIPYWCYALVCLLLKGIFGGSGVAADGFHIGSMTGAEVFYWLIPTGKQTSRLPFLVDALWYVPVYLLCVLFVPLLRRWKERPWPVVALLVTLLLGFERLGWYYPQNVAFYSLWIFAGFHYADWKRRYIDSGAKRWELLLAAGMGIALVALICVCGNATADMQVNKFPPNGVFLAFSVAAMSLLTLLLPAIVRLMNRLGRVRALAWGMKQLSQHSLSVYLYQPLAFLLLWQLMGVGSDLGLRYRILFVGCCVLILPLGAVLGAIFGPLENLGRRKRT